MKKYILAFILILFFGNVNFSFGAYQIQGKGHTERIERGSVVELKAIDSITTENAKEGDLFNSITTSDIEINGNIVLPKGTLVRGSIEKINGAKRLSKSAQLYLNFDHIVTSSGKQIPIRAGICSFLRLTDDGGITDGGNYGYALSENWKKTVAITKNATNWGINSGDKMFNGGRFLLTPFAALGGAIGGGFYYVGDSIADLFRKGNDVIINEGKLFNIILMDSVDIPVL